MFFISTLPTLHSMSFLSHLNTNARRLCSTYRPYRHVGHVLSLLLLYFFSGDRYGPGRTSYYILTTPSFSLCTRKWIFTQILACHVTRLTGPIYKYILSTILPYYSIFSCKLAITSSTLLKIIYLSLEVSNLK